MRAATTRTEFAMALFPVHTAAVVRHDPKENKLLAALPEIEWQRWLPHLEWVGLPLGKVLYEAGSTLSHVYFPTTAIVSMLYVMENGASAEIAVVGNEGLVGVSLFMGSGSTPSRAVALSTSADHACWCATCATPSKPAPGRRSSARMNFKTM